MLNCRFVQSLYFYPEPTQMQNPLNKVVVLATGGTIAGRAGSPTDNVGYKAGEVGVAELLAAVPALSAWQIEAEQVAQLDSKDMDVLCWRQLARRAHHHLQRSDVAGLVITHGTDTLEETAWFLHRVLAPGKPVVLTAAMRPASSLQADGPQNLLDAVTVASAADARGVVAVLAGRVIAAQDLRKLHTSRIDAFDGGDAGPIACLEQGALRRFRDWPEGASLGLEVIESEPESWPWVAVVANHQGSDGREVEALVAAGAQGLVVAGTGNGTLSQGLEAALIRAQGAGVPVRRTSRCALGAVIEPPVEANRSVLRSYGALSPWQTRVELMLELLARR